jgi:hypothetical protein
MPGSRIEEAERACMRAVREGYLPPKWARDILSTEKWRRIYAEEERMKEGQNAKKQN